MDKVMVSIDLPTVQRLLDMARLGHEAQEAWLTMLAEQLARPPQPPAAPEPPSDNPGG